MVFRNKDEVVLHVLQTSGPLSKRNLNIECINVIDKKTYYDSINKMGRMGILITDSEGNIAIGSGTPVSTTKSITTKSDTPLDFGKPVTFEEEAAKQQKIAEAFGETGEAFAADPEVAESVGVPIEDLPKLMIEEDQEALIKGKIVEVEGDFPTMVIRAAKEIYKIRKCPTFIDNQSILLKIEGHIAAKEDQLLIGDKGTGKTVAVYNIAKMRDVPLIRVPCSRGTLPEKLLGHYMYKEGEGTIFKLGAIPTAIEIANETGFAILLFDEVNALNEEVQKILNPITDWRKEAVIEEIGGLFVLNENARLFVIGTANPAGYGGTFDFNEELVSRFSFTRVRYMTRREENKVLAKNVSDAPAEFVNSITGVAESIRAAVISGVIRYAPSIRDLESVCRLYVAYKKLELDEKTTLSVAISSLIDKYELEERDIVVTKFQEEFPEL